jgi:hypothetical protein
VPDLPIFLTSAGAFFAAVLTAFFTGAAIFFAGAAIFLVADLALAAPLNMMAG